MSKASVARCFLGPNAPEHEVQALDDFHRLVLAGFRKATLMRGDDMTNEKIVQRIEDMLNARSSSCLCSLRETCEVCDRASQINLLAEDLITLKRELLGWPPETSLSKLARMRGSITFPKIGGPNDH